MRFVDRLWFPLVRLIMLPFRIVPLAWSRAMGRALGLFAYYVVPIRKSVVRRNLECMFGDEWDAARLERGVREAYVGFGLAIAEFIWAENFTPENVARYVHLEGLEHYEAAHADGRSVILYGSHQGMWEWATTFPHFTGRPFHVVMKRIHNEAVDRYVTWRRQRFGVIAVSQRGAVTALKDLVTAGVDYGVFVDQRAANGKGVWVDIHGHPVAAMAGSAVLSLRGDLKLLPIRVFRTKQGMTFRFHPALDVPRTGDEAVDVQRLTQAILDPTTEWIREQPDAYFWLHNRFKIHDAEREAAERFRAGLKAPVAR